MDSRANLHIIISIIGPHRFGDILLHGLFYLQSLLDIMALLTLGTLSLMIFALPSIVSRILISSLSFHLLSTVIFVGSNFMPPVPKFYFIFMMMNPFLGSTTAFIMVFLIIRIIQEMKEKSHHCRSLPLEEIISSFILCPDPLSWTSSLITSPCSSCSIDLVCIPLSITITK